MAIFKGSKSHPTPRMALPAQLDEEPPQPYRDPEAPLQDYAPRMPTVRRRTLSEAAAQARQDVLDLEEALRACEQERDNFRAESASFALTIRELKERLAALEEQRNTYRDRVIQIEAKFDAAAKIMLDVLEIPRDVRPQMTPQPEVTIGAELKRLVEEHNHDDLKSARRSQSRVPTQSGPADEEGA